MGRLSHCGGAVLAWPLAANDRPTPTIATADITRPALTEAVNRATPEMTIATMAISNELNRLVPAAAFHGSDVRI
jgi:hypothetical protein